MRAEAAVRYLLANAAGVTAIVPATRIFGGAAHDESAAPLLIYRKLGAQRPAIEMLDPISQAILVRAQIEVLCVAPTYAQLKDLGEAVRKALLYELGSVAGVTLHGIELQDEGVDLYDPDLREFGQSFTYEVSYDEPAP